MSDNNRKDGDFSLSDMREIFEQYAPAEDDATTSEEKIEKKTGGNADSRRDEEVTEKPAPDAGEQGEIPAQEQTESPRPDELSAGEEESPAPESVKDNVYKFVPPDDLSGEDIPKQNEPEYPTEQALDDFDMPTDSAFAVNLSEQERDSLRDYERELEEAEKAENKDRGFKKFIKNIIPVKGDGAAEIIRKVVFMAAIVTVFVSAGMLINTYLVQPNIVDNDIKDIKPTEANSWEEIKEKYPDVDFPEGMQLKYAEAYAQNTDLVGWLTIDKLQMDFPILQTDNDSYYLKRSFTHRYTDLGNPFLACKNSIDPLDKNSIIYGHSTRTSDKIFSKLFDYRTTRGFINNPIINFNTIYHDYKWKVYAVFITNATTDADNGYFFNYVWTNISEESFKGYVAEINRRRLYDTGVDIRTTDKILTLSTCLYEFDNARLVVVARMLRDGESEEIDASLVKTNPNPQYPQAWYDKENKTNPYKNVQKWYPN